MANSDYIISKITDINSINDNCIVLLAGRYDSDTYALLNNSVGELDIHHDNLHTNFDSNISILEAIEMIIPDGYRLYVTYRKLMEEFHIIVRRGSYICNDPCCFFLFCKNRPLYDCVCLPCIRGTGNPVYDFFCCLWTCEVCPCLF